jgi:hypothetical protein
LPGRPSEALDKWRAGLHQMFQEEKRLSSTVFLSSCSFLFTDLSAEL